ncbi:MAG TPA: hypothetical protein VFO78_04480 [Candidatus Limnocylindrales bacterium]|nr:hypothetical protein [Candidatus Limnocylindrales bacterium]
MSGDFDDLLRRWLRDRAGADRTSLRAMAGNVAALPPRRQPRGLWPLVASLVVMLGLIAVLATRSGQVGGDPGPGLSQTAERSPSTTMSPEPAWLRGALEALACDGAPTGFGYGWRRGDFGTTEQPSADRAMADLLAQVGDHYEAFPTEGFRRTGGSRHTAVYEYAWRGSARAVVIVRSATPDGSGPWYVDDVASCDPSEMGPDVEPGVEVDVWRDPSGRRLEPAFVSELADCYDGTKLIVNGRLFVWDPNLGRNHTYDPSRLESTFADDVELPQDATDTGYSGSGRHLYLAPDGTAAYVVRPHSVQRWPHVIGDDYQRTDCN